MVTIIDPTGVKNIFIPPQALQTIVHQGMQILKMWEEENQKGIVIASATDIKQAPNLFAQSERFKKGK